MKFYTLTINLIVLKAKVINTQNSYYFLIILLHFITPHASIAAMWWKSHIMMCYYAHLFTCGFRDVTLVV